MKRAVVSGDTLTIVNMTDDEVLDFEAQRVPQPPSVHDVKAEARRRILGRFPDWKQQNMTARGVELQDVWRREGKWDAAETDEADALAAAWTWIKAVRSRSGEIEAMNPIPVDFAADARWPA